MLGAGTVPPDGVCKTKRLQLFIFQHIPQTSVLFNRLIAAVFRGDRFKGQRGRGASKLEKASGLGMSSH